MKTVYLITGVTGFVGSQILKNLLSKNLECRVIIRPNKLNYFKEEFSSIDDIILSEDLFKENVEWWARVTKGISVIIHAAWFAEPGKYINSNKNYECLIGTINMARGAIDSGVNKFVGLGTCFEYDLKYGLLNTNTPLDPDTPYSVSKISTFLILKDLFNIANIEFNWCRLFYLYGEGEHPNRLVPYIKNQIHLGQPVHLTNGYQIRDYLDVKLAAAMIVDITLNKNKESVFNICSGVPITVREFANSIAISLGKSELLQFGSREENKIDPPVILGVR